MKTSEEFNNISKNMAKFRTQLVQPKKDAENPYLKNGYVTLEGVIATIDKGMEGTGLSFIQEAKTGALGQSVIIKTTLFHESGQYMELESLEIPSAKKDAQGLGSAITYAKRYALSTIFGITSEADDDGNEASNVTQKRTTQTNSRKNQNKTAPKPTQKPISKITESQKKTIFDKAKQIDSVKNISIKAVFEAFKITDIEKLNTNEADEKISGMTLSLENMKKAEK
ncbi:ERF family protein [Dellaglioa sp. BT-FLS60]